MQLVLSDYYASPGRPMSDGDFGVYDLGMQCDAHYTFSDPERCLRTAKFTMILGCRAEHVRTRSLCAPCTDETKRGQMVCIPCLRLGLHYYLKAHKITKLE